MFWCVVDIDCLRKHVGQKHEDHKDSEKTVCIQQRPFDCIYIRVLKYIPFQRMNIWTRIHKNIFAFNIESLLETPWMHIIMQWDKFDIQQTQKPKQPQQTMFRLVWPWLRKSHQRWLVTQHLNFQYFEREKVHLDREHEIMMLLVASPSSQPKVCPD